MLEISDTVGFADLELLPGNPEVVFATAWKAERKPWTIISGGSNDEGGLYKSVDGGASWRKITVGLPTGLIGKIDLAISPADNSIVYALVEAPDDEGGLYRSEDQGETFTQVSSEGGIRTRPFYYANIDVDPQDPNKVYSMATRYYRSDDGGESWTAIRPPHGDNHDMWINPEDPDLFIQANDGGANVTFNGGETWSTQFNQPTTEVYQVEVDDQYPYWLYAGQQDNGSTICRAEPCAVPGAESQCLADRDRRVRDRSQPYRSPAITTSSTPTAKAASACSTRSPGRSAATTSVQPTCTATIPRDLRYRFQRVAPIHVSPHDPDVVYHASQYVHRTTNDGVTWETISPDLTAFEDDKQVISGSPITRDITGEEFYSTIYSLRESPVERGVIWSGANDGPVYVTRDNGDSWENVTPRGLPAGGRVDSVEPSPHDAAAAYISVLRYQFGDWKPYIYKTENYGARWRLLTERPQRHSGRPSCAGRTRRPGAAGAAVRGHRVRHVFVSLRRRRELGGRSSRTCRSRPVTDHQGGPRRSRDLDDGSRILLGSRQHHHAASGAVARHGRRAGTVRAEGDRSLSPDLPQQRPGGRSRSIRNPPR